ncbi:MAG: GTP-binding protein Era, partial [Myxococcota bacterium]
MFQQIIDDIIGRHGEPSERESAASRLIDTCGYAAAAATLLPIPGTEIIAVMPIHVGMVVGLSQIYDAEITRDSATDLVLRIGATVGASLITSRAATTLAKIALPGLGGFIGAPIIFATTIAIGAVARAFFDRGGEVSSEEMRDIYKKAVKNARRNFDPKRARSSTAKDMAQKATEDSEPEDNKTETPPPPAPTEAP